MIVRLLGIASIASAVWWFADHKSWSRFWGKSVVKMRKSTPGARAMAAGELALGLWLTLRRRDRRGGHAAKFRLSEGHPITAA